VTKAPCCGEVNVTGREMSGGRFSLAVGTAAVIPAIPVKWGVRSG